MSTRLVPSGAVPSPPPRGRPDDWLSRGRPEVVTVAGWFSGACGSVWANAFNWMGWAFVAVALAALVLGRPGRWLGSPPWAEPAPPNDTDDTTRARLLDARANRGWEQAKGSGVWRPACPVGPVDSLRPPIASGSYAPPAGGEGPELFAALTPPPPAPPAPQGDTDDTTRALLFDARADRGW